jgi:hypothetical protein
VDETVGFAVVNFFDLSTNEFRQCVNAGFNLTVLSNGRAALSFVTEGGFNCPIALIEPERAFRWINESMSARFRVG